MNKIILHANKTINPYTGKPTITNGKYLVMIEASRHPDNETYIDGILDETTGMIVPPSCMNCGAQIVHNPDERFDYYRDLFFGVISYCKDCVDVQSFD